VKQDIGWRAVVVACMIALLAGCGGGTPGDAARGEQLFSGKLPLGGSDTPPCAECHAVKPDETVPLGNNLSNIGNRAATRKPGTSAEDYLRNSILNPDSYLVPGYQEGIMFRGYQAVLKLQQINDLIAYMLTLKSGQDE
jgi:sulfur-oxidizing protein SoxX